MVVDLAGQPRFIIGATVGLGISKAIGLAIGGVVSIGTDVAVSFFGLSL